MSNGTSISFSRVGGRKSPNGGLERIAPPALGWAGAHAFGSVEGLAVVRCVSSTVTALRQYGQVIVLHAAWLSRSGRLALWAEHEDRPPTAPARQKRVSQRARAHPFALDPDRLRLAVGEVAGVAAADLLGEGSVELTLKLPDAGEGPIGFPLHDGPPTGAPGRPRSASSVEVPFSLWTAPGYVVDPSLAAKLLSTVASAQSGEQPFPDAGPVGVALAPDIRFAAHAVAMVVELLSRGRLLPHLEFVAGRWTACWRPLVDGQDRGRIEALVWALPASLMAVRELELSTDKRHDERDMVPSDEVLRTLMWAVTDALARGLVTPVAPTAGRQGAKANVVDAWVRALSSPDGVVSGSGEDECAQLAGSLAEWHATRTADVEAVRTCFRIVPPSDDDEDQPIDTARAPARPEKGKKKDVAVSEPSWRIGFALQAVDDPSLVVSADDVWSDGPELTAIGRHVAHPDEHLLRGLGRAARLVPMLGHALASAAPSDYATDAAGIVTFLREGAPILEEAGFGVLAPPWWRSSRSRLGLRLKARTGSKGGTSTGALGLEGLRDIRWEAVLGDDTLGLTELRQLARLKQPLVRVRGQWVELHHDELLAAISAVGKRGETGDVMSAGEVLRSALGFEPGPGELPVAEVTADGWLGDLLSGAEDRTLEPTPTPDGFAGELRPYQERGLGWLSFLGELGLGACLADDMGLGKTAQLLALLVQERAQTARTPRARRPNWDRPSSCAPCPWSETGSTRRPASLRNWSSTSTMGRIDSQERRSPDTRVRWTWSSRPTASPRATPSCWPAPAGIASFSTRPSRSRTVQPARPRASVRFRLSSESP